MSGDGSDTAYETIAFWSPAMPHWVHLSPQICHAFETLLDHRPRYPNVITADAVETLAHETMHSVGVSVEAQAECYGMQLAATVAEKLGVPVAYANSLARLNLDNYKHRPPNYINTDEVPRGRRLGSFPGQGLAALAQRLISVDAPRWLPMCRWAIFAVEFAAIMIVAERKKGALRAPWLDAGAVFVYEARKSGGQRLQHARLQKKRRRTCHTRNRGLRTCQDRVSMSSGPPLTHPGSVLPECIANVPLAGSIHSEP